MGWFRIVLSFSLLSASALADSSTGSGEDRTPFARPTCTTWLRVQPEDQLLFWRRSFQRNNRPYFWGIVAATGFLIATDQYLYERTKKVGDQLNISHEGQQKTIAKTKIPGFDYTVRLNGPYNLGTGLYFLGDGVTHFSIAGGLLGWGWVHDDERALSTSSQLLEAMVANGFVVQILKHVTGRENPNTVTSSGGRWRFFPNQKDYAKNVAKYDAFPSGHLSTAMVTVTVVSLNYPEHRWIRPVGYTLMTGLAFQMVNNGVHWYSDYPLAIGMGYLFGHIAAQRAGAAGARSTPMAWQFNPGPVAEGWGVLANRRF